MARTATMLPFLSALSIILLLFVSLLLLFRFVLVVFFLVWKWEVINLKRFIFIWNEFNLLRILAESRYSLADTGLRKSSLISTSLLPTAIRTRARPVFASMLRTWWNKYGYKKVTTTWNRWTFLFYLPVHINLGVSRWATVRLHR